MTVITGTYEKTLFRNETSGSTMFLFNTRDLQEYKTRNGFILCYGIVPVYTKDMPLKICGRVVQKQKDYIFEIESIEPYTNNEEVIVNYLSGDIFKGVGPKTARKIIALTGPNIFEFIKRKDAKDILSSNFPELKKYGVENFIKTLKNTEIQEEIYKNITPFGGTYYQAQKLFAKYGVNAIASLKSDPYTCGYQAGLPFAVCDSLAKSIDIYPYDEKRIKSIIYRVLDQNESAGNTYITLDTFLRVLSCVTKQFAYSDVIPLSLLCNSLNVLSGVKVIKNDEYKIFRKRTFEYEEQIAENLYRLNRDRSDTLFSDEDIKNVESAFNIKYAYNQKKAFDMLRSTGVKILTGGPGTGKTTVIRGLVHLFKQLYPNKTFALTAPTGRAAQRITESTGLPASTIHKLLDIKPYNDTFTSKTSADPIEADLIIVDEISMVNTEIMALLLGAIKSGSTVILSGDIDQLPCVGCGNILNDIIESDSLDVYRLDVIYRQKSNSSIVALADNVRKGVIAFKADKEVSLYHFDSPEMTNNKVLDLIKKTYSKNNIFSSQILVTTKRGPIGNKSLNSLIQRYLNDSDVTTEIDGVLFNIGDKVMTVRNNYEDGYFNGDMGIVENIDSSGISVNINDETVVVKNHNIKDLVLAYSSTVHKSQGSQYDTVIVVLPQDPENMLQRNLLYTAITRTKKRLIIISQGNAFEKSVLNNKLCKRQTDLVPKIKAIFNRGVSK